MPPVESIHGVHPPSVVARFWPKVTILGASDCWEWTASRKGRMGYGQFIPTVGRTSRIPRPAHRVAWEIANGAIPTGIFVCHRCDNPPCCNPAHLFLGTHQDNVDDMVAKGRHPSSSRFTPDKRSIVLKMSADGRRQVDIAAAVGMSQSFISRFLSGAVR